MIQKQFKRGQEIELNVSDLAFGGKGISKIDKLTIFVKNGIPGQKIKAKISKSKKKFIEAYHTHTLSKSKDEVDPKCEHFPICGGCTTQQLEYNKQASYKQKQTKDIFKKIGNISNPVINDIIKCDIVYNYRNKMEYTISGNPWYVGDESYDDIIIGLHVPKRFDKILSINKCHINDEIFNNINHIVKDISLENNLVPYDVIKHTGFLRFLVIRMGIHTNEIMVNLVTSGFKPKLIQPIAKKLINDIPNIKSIVNTINANKNNTATGNIKTIYGENYINEKIGKYQFKVSANSFFQTNSYQVKILYDYIVKIGNFKNIEVVYDLYCGTGTIGIYIANFVKKVYGIELIEDAISDAKYNSKVNNIKNIMFFAGDLKDFLSKNRKNIDLPDTIIVDPPRPGLHKNTVKDIIELKPTKIIYVSCNPPTQARDINLFLNDNYNILDIQPIDMFPHTPHIECIVTLIKN